jgi:hypothetical protein
MEKQLYVREGRRFVKVAPSQKVKDCTGLYYNSDGSFTESPKDEKHPLLCVDQSDTVYTLCKMIPHKGVNWFQAMELAKEWNLVSFPSLSYLPTRVQLLSAALKYENIFKKAVEHSGYQRFWTRDQRDKYNAWLLGLYENYFGYVSSDGKDFYSSVIPFAAFVFVDIPIYEQKETNSTVR